MGILNWLKGWFSSDDSFLPPVEKESKKVDDTSEKTQKDMVFSNKELRDLLILFEANENTIDSFDVQIQLKHNVTHETGLEFGHDLEYKGFKYKLLGVIDEEEADAFFDEKINSLEGFLEIIGEKEISHLDDSINFLCEKMYTGYINEVKWLDNAPIEIIEEFKNKYSADNYHVLSDKHERDGNLEYYGQSEFKEEYNNIQNITLNFKIKEKYHDKRFSPFYEIDWINDVKTFSNNIKESKKVDDTSENKNSEPEVIDKDKIITVKYEGLELNTTLNILDDNNLFYEIEDNKVSVYLESGRLEECCKMEPESYFNETIMHRFKSGYVIGFESNYKVPKGDQSMLFDYSENDKYAPYISSWYCYFDNDDKLTNDKDLINKILKDAEGNFDGTYSPNGLSIQRLDLNNLIQDLDYYW